MNALRGGRARARPSTCSSSATPPSRTSGSPRRQASSRCASATGGQARIFYRQRPNNIARKAGNIADWVERFGGAYPQFLILDADSLMTGETLVRLVARDGARIRTSA